MGLIRQNLRFAMQKYNFFMIYARGRDFFLVERCVAHSKIVEGRKSKVESRKQGAPEGAIAGEPPASQVAVVACKVAVERRFGGAGASGASNDAFAGAVCDRDKNARVPGEGARAEEGERNRWTS